MPKITVTPNGIKGAVAPGGNRTPPKRGLTRGWTAAVARRNRDFLMSIDPLALDGVAVSASLTLGRQSRVKPRDVARWRDTLMKRLQRAGLLRAHWVLEFQKDGTPHLHGIFFFPAHAHQTGDHLAGNVAAAWLDLVHQTGAEWPGQHVVPVNALLGWLQYLAKHGARSAAHYQRRVPEGWENPGRMWGKSGEWPLQADEVETDRATFFRLRRAIAAWRRADARKALLSAIASGRPSLIRSAKRRVVLARSSLQAPSRARAETLGFAEWVPDTVAAALVVWAARHGAGFVRDWDEREQVPPFPEPARPALPMKGRRDAQAGRGRAVRS